MIMIDMNNLITEPFIRDAKCQASKETDLENGMQIQQRNSDFGMEEFNKQIQEAEIQVDKLSGLLNNLKALLRDANEESKSVTKASEITAIKNRLEKYVDDVGKIARNVRGKLQVITIDNLLLRQMPGCQKGTASDRARMNMTSVLTKKLMELMVEFEILRQTIQNEYREVVERRVIAVTDTRPDESMIDHLIETGNNEQMFQNVFEQMGQGKVFSTVEEIQERLDAVKEIEKRLSELHRIYLKTAVLVEGQAKILENIENQLIKLEVVLKLKLLVDIGDERRRPLSVKDQYNPDCREVTEDIKKLHDVLHHITAGNSNHKRPPSLEAMEEVTDGNDTRK